MDEEIDVTNSAPPKRVDAPAFKEIGQIGLKQTSGYVYEEFVPKLRWPKAGEVYLEMSSNDPVITAILLCARQLIRRVTWQVKPFSTGAEDMKMATFLEECRNDMSMTWSDLIDDITSSFEYGFSFHELVYKRRNGSNNNPHQNSKFSDNLVDWRKIAGRSQTSLSSWSFDEEGGLQAMNQLTSNGIVSIPITKALLFRTTNKRGNPEGRSFLRGAYRPWYFKKHIEEIEGIGIERDLAGLPVIKAPPGIDIFDEVNPNAKIAKESALKLVVSIRRDRNEGVVLPDGWQLELLSASGTRQFDTTTIINRYDQRIAITMLADIVMLGADKVGSFALAKTKQSMLSASLDAQLASICDIFNKYAIPRLFALNGFPIDKLPTLTCSPVVAPDLKELGAYISSLAGAKMPLFPDIDLENVLRRIASLPETKEDDAGRKERIERSSNQTKTPEKTTEKGGEQD